MTPLVWDQVGSRSFQTGVDRGVLYLADKTVPWNGIVGIDETPMQDTSQAYLDGVKYLNSQTPSEYSAVLKALTYPDEFETVLGVHEHGDGFFIHEQAPQTFGLSYRTKLGDDVDGIDAGYRIHLLYNVLAAPTPMSFSTLSNSVTPTEFSWNLLATPQVIPGHRPTAHVSLDSTSMVPEILAMVEELIYGTDSVDAVLPPLADLYSMIDLEESIIITDLGDGTWTAMGSDTAVYMLDATIFEIDGVDGSFSDADTYTISTTLPD